MPPPSSVKYVHDHASQRPFGKRDRGNGQKERDRAARVRRAEEEKRTITSLYDGIVRFMTEYFPAYSEYGQVVETHRAMDQFYAADLSFPDDGVSSREQWYERCLNHPAIQDRITLEHLCVDEKQQEVGALARTQAIDRATGQVLPEVRMNVSYRLRIDLAGDIKIVMVKVFLETDPAKVARLTQLYRIGP